jgi:hypothetical protein
MKYTKRLIMLFIISILILILLFFHLCGKENTMQYIDYDIEKFESIKSENASSIDNEKTTSSTSPEINSLIYDTNSEVSNIEHSKCSNIDSSQCKTGSCGNTNLYPILDPKFNMREVSKQCLLLEDHMNNIKKRCYDCIRKHFLIIDGLLEEAVSLEQDNASRQYYRDLHKEWIKIEKAYAKDSQNLQNIDNISKSIRFFRKPLVEKYFDTVSEYDV